MNPTERRTTRHTAITALVCRHFILQLSLILVIARAAVHAQARGIPDDPRPVFRGSQISLDYGSAGAPQLAGFRRAIGVTGTVTFGPLVDSAIRPFALSATVARAVTRQGVPVTSYGASLQLGILSAGIGYVDSLGFRGVHVPLELMLEWPIAIRSVAIVPWVQTHADYHYVGGGYHFNYPASGFGVDVDTRANIGIRLVAQRWNGPVGQVWITSIGMHWSTFGNARDLSP